jgi:hypothetical protein
VGRVVVAAGCGFGVWCVGVEGGGGGGGGGGARTELQNT